MVGKVAEAGYFFVVHPCKLVDGQELLRRIKEEVFGIVVGEIERIGAVAGDKKLYKAQKGRTGLGRRLRR
jgi:hypothetical protein